MKQKVGVFYWLNTTVPIVLSGLFYYCYLPETFFVKRIDAILPFSFHFAPNAGMVFNLIRNYALDAGWAYALFFALSWIMGNEKTDRLRVYIMAGSMAIGIEILQMSPLIGGTFDIWDIVVELLAQTLAMCIIIKFTRSVEI